MNKQKKLQKLNRRGYGNRPFRNYPGPVSIVPQSITETEGENISWVRRLLNWLKN